MRAINHPSDCAARHGTGVPRTGVRRAGRLARGAGLGLLLFAQAFAQPSAPPLPRNTIDLPTALRLAGADNLEVQLAQEKLVEVRAATETVRARYFPWVAPAIVFRRHENNIQTVDGAIIDADKQSMAIGVTFNAQVDLGEVYFQNLVAQQAVRVGEAVVAGRQREVTYRAAAGYFELARAHAAVGAATEAVRLAALHAEQIDATASAGLTFQGDAARVRAAHERSRLELNRLRVEQRIAAARLSELLRLDPVVELTPVEMDLAPLTLIAPSGEVGPLIAGALARRPELDEGAARLEAARIARRGTTQGPLIPTVGAQIGYGGLGGGRDSTGFGRNFDVSEDYSFGVSWRVGPGGLFDRNRQREAASRERQVELELEKIRDAIRRQVVEHHARVAALAEQIELARRTVESAELTARLSRQRRETGVSAALEDVQAEDELARARRDYFATVADFNQAQYALRFATGE